MKIIEYTLMLNNKLNNFYGGGQRCYAEILKVGFITGDWSESTKYLICPIISNHNLNNSNLLSE